MKKILTAIVFAAVMAWSVSPAQADQQRFQDATGDVTAPQADIQSVKVKLRKKQVTITVRYAHLPKQDFSDSLRVWIDTSKKRKAPNFLVAVEGYETQFGSTSGWKLRPNGLDPYGDVMCNTGYKYDRKNNQMLFRFKSKCIGNPSKIRVAVTAEHYDLASDDGSLNSVKDHLVSKRRFTGWVRK
jgi:hypothetical protein